MGHVVGAGCPNVLIGDWMITGGGLVSAMAEVDDLEMMRCYTKDIASLTPRFNRLSGMLCIFKFRSFRLFLT